jgi:hypothetical protein
MDRSSVERVRELLGPGWSPPAISVTDEVKSQIEEMHGDLMPHILPSLVGLSPEVAMSLGGVEVVAPDGQRLSAWPDRTQAGRGYCLRCHRHNALAAEPGGFRCSECGNVQADDGIWVAA